MNWIELLNEFYDLLQCNMVSNNAQLLYYTLLQINNRCSWITWFQRTNVNLSGITGIGEKALINARNELKQLGLIDFITSKKRGECTKYSILYRTNDGTKEVQTQYKGSTKEVQSADIVKPKLKPKPKQDNPIIPFDDFWALYPRKVAKSNAEKAWDKIKPDESLFAIIKKTLETFKKSEAWIKDNGKFIPHPATWLNGKRWEDEVSVELNPERETTYNLDEFEKMDLSEFL